MYLRRLPLLLSALLLAGCPAAGTWDEEIARVPVDWDREPMPEIWGRYSIPATAVTVRSVPWPESRPLLAPYPELLDFCEKHPTQCGARP